VRKLVDRGLYPRLFTGDLGIQRELDIVLGGAKGLDFLIGFLVPEPWKLLAGQAERRPGPGPYISR